MSGSTRLRSLREYYCTQLSGSTSILPKKGIKIIRYYHRCSSSEYYKQNWLIKLFQIFFQWKLFEQVSINVLQIFCLNFWPCLTAVTNSIKLVGTIVIRLGNTHCSQPKPVLIFKIIFEVFASGFLINVF